MTVFALRHSSRPHGDLDLDVLRAWPGALPGRTFGAAAEGGELRAIVNKIAAKPPAKLQPAFYMREGVLVLHQDVVATFPQAWGLRWVPQPVVVQKNAAPIDGYVQLIVDRFLPIDREASTVTTMGDKHPLLMHPFDLDEIRMPQGVEVPPLFRLADYPRTLAVRADVAVHLAKVTGKLLQGAANAPWLDPVGYGWRAPFVLELDAARAAYAAFWRLLTDRDGAADREAALLHPVLAVAVALEIDRAASEQTRRAAMAHPWGAVMYALHVDRGPREDTRAAAQKSEEGALNYALEVDLELTAAAGAALLKDPDSWDAESVASLQESLEEKRLVYRGGAASPPRAPDAKPATRTLPTIAPVPRYRERQRGTVAPLGAELREDIEAMTAHGFAWLGLAADASPAEIIDAVHLAISAVQAGERALPRGKAAMQARLGMACALADALHRGLGWQWAAVGPAGTATVVSPDDRHGVVPLTPIARLAVRGGKSNTLALMFNMIADGRMPPAVEGEVVLIS